MQSLKNKVILLFVFAFLIVIEFLELYNVAIVIDELNLSLVDVYGNLWFIHTWGTVVLLAVCIVVLSAKLIISDKKK